MKSNSFQSAMEAIELLSKHYPPSMPHFDNLRRLKTYLLQMQDTPLGHYRIPDELIISAQHAFEDAFKDCTVATAHDAMICYKFIKILEDTYHPRLFTNSN